MLYNCFLLHLQYIYQFPKETWSKVKSSILLNNNWNSRKNDFLFPVNQVWRKIVILTHLLNFSNKMFCEDCKLNIQKLIPFHVLLTMGEQIYDKECLNPEKKYLIMENRYTALASTPQQVVYLRGLITNHYQIIFSYLR